MVCRVLEIVVFFKDMGGLDPATTPQRFYVSVQGMKKGN